MNEPAADVRFDAGSFRDPGGRVFHLDNRVFRCLKPDTSTTFEAFASSPLFQRLIAGGQLVATSWQSTAALGLNAGEFGPRVLEHARVPFITYPFEWSFDMLRDSALLTLDLLDASLEAGFVVKDATPYNVQFVEGRPTWIDVLSVVPRTGDDAWVGYSQFCATQLFPLMLTAYRHVEFQPWLRANLNGIPGPALARLLGGRDRLRPAVVTHVTLPRHFERMFGKRPHLVARARQQLKVPARAIRKMADRLRRIILDLRYSPGASPWADYTDTRTYSEAGIAAKAAFVRRAASHWSGRQVWDLGANTGEFAAVAAGHARTVVAFDMDPAAVNRLYLGQKAQQVPRNVQPVVGDLTNPSPGLGWQLEERQPWSARGNADGFLALALVHHLRVTGGIPAAAIVDGLATIAPRGVVEFVDRSDAMVKAMLANREDVFADYDLEKFELQLERRFSVEHREALPGNTRVLYEVVRH